MKCVIGKARSGKTLELIQISARGFLHIVCRDHKTAWSISQTAKQAELDIPFPLTFREFLSGSFCGRGIKGFVIDDADDLLRELARGVPVEAFSMRVGRVES